MDRHLVLSLTLLVVSSMFCQESAAQNFGADSAAARMRPAGSASAVDQYRRQNRLQETQYDQRYRDTLQSSAPVRKSPVRQVAMLQSGFSAPGLPGEVAADSAAIGQPALPTNPRQNVPGSTFQGQPLPLNPTASNPPARGQIVVSPSDAAPMPQPNLANGFATLDNCNCVSPASGYSAASGIGCGSNLGYVWPASCNTPATPSRLPQGYVPQNYGYAAPPAQVPGPAVMPVNPGFAGGGITGSALGGASVPRALISLGQQNNAVQVGQGLWGQPVAYVPGQSIRNWVRYFFP